MSFELQKYIFVCSSKVFLWSPSCHFKEFVCHFNKSLMKNTFSSDLHTYLKHIFQISVSVVFKFLLFVLLPANLNGLLLSKAHNL